MSSKRIRRWRLLEWVVRTFRIVGWTMAAIAGLVAVLMSPFALRAIDRVSGLNWPELANVGQTYEAVAALLAVPTFGGVMISLLVQRREVHVGQEQTALLTQIELARIAIDNPELVTADGSIPTSESLAQARRETLMNLWMSKWRSLFSLGNLTERELREILNRFFRGDESREWWRTARDSYRVGVEGRGQRRFGKIADEQYAHASSLHADPPSTEHKSSTSPSAVRTGVVCLIVAALGGASGWFLGRHHAR